MIDAYQQTADQFSIDIRLANHIHIPYTLDTDLQEVHNRLMESSSSNNISSIYFESITGSRLPLSEKIGNQRNYPVLLKIIDTEKNSRTFALNFSDQFKITDRSEESLDVSNEEHFYDFSKDIGLKGYQLYSLPYFSHKLMQSLPVQNKTNLTSADIADSMTSVLRYMTTREEKQLGNEMISIKDFSKAKDYLEKLEIKVGADASEI